MKSIQTSKPEGMPRFIYALLVYALLAIVGVRSGIAADEGPKVTVVYDHALPNVPGKSLKGILVEYGPGVATPGHIHPKSAFIYATVLEGAIRTSVNDGPAVVYKAGGFNVERARVVDAAARIVRVFVFEDGTAIQ